jgi:hypothetical protein
LACSLRKNNRVKGFVIGVYRRALDSSKIDEVVGGFIKRVKVKFPSASILVFGDMNTNDTSYLRITFGLEVGIGEYGFTRIQKRGDTLLTSRLDYFLSNEIMNVKRLNEKGGSDHYPLWCDTRCRDVAPRRRFLTFKRINRKPSNDEIEALRRSPGWPFIEPSIGVQSLAHKVFKIKPKLFLKCDVNDLLKQNWELFKSKLMVIYKNNFSEFLEDVNLSASINSKDFFKNILRVLKYKKKGSIVKRIREDTVLSESESLAHLEDYYSKVFGADEEMALFNSNGTMSDIKVYLDRGICKLA